LIEANLIPNLLKHIDSNSITKTITLLLIYDENNIDSLDEKILVQSFHIWISSKCVKIIWIKYFN